MNTVKANPSTMPLAALSWAIAKCEVEIFGEAASQSRDYLNPAEALPILDREKINFVNPTFSYFETEYPWLAIKVGGPANKEIYGSGQTIIEAGLRCYLQSLVDEIDVPADLMNLEPNQPKSKIQPINSGAIDLKSPNVLGMEDHQEIFPGASIQEIGEILMQDIVGEYDTPDLIPEWIWVQKTASFSHCSNGVAGIWEYVINLGNDLIDIPERMQPVIQEARQKNLVYVIFHQGT